MIPYRRAAVAALLTAAAIALPGAAWYVVGSREAEREARRLEEEPHQQARLISQRLALRLASRLEALREAEQRRPFYHYQNLYYDPKGASEGASVSPSPLVEGPQDPLIRAYFQIDATGRVSLPTLNEEVPEGNKAEGLEEQRAILRALQPAALSCRQVARVDAVPPFEPAQTENASPVVASALPPDRPAVRTPDPVQAGSAEPNGQQQTAALDRTPDPQPPQAPHETPALPAHSDPPAPHAPLVSAPSSSPDSSSQALSQSVQRKGKEQVQVLDNDAWAYNANPNKVYSEIKSRNARNGQAQSQARSPSRQETASEGAGSMSPNPSPAQSETVTQSSDPNSAPSSGQAPAESQATATQAGLAPQISTVTLPLPATQDPAQIKSPLPQAESPAAAPGLTPQLPPLPPRQMQSQLVPAREVVIRTGVLEWGVAPISGHPTLIAARWVSTPAGVLTQGFQVSEATISSWLRESAFPARMLPGPAASFESATLPLEGPAWHVKVDAGTAIQEGVGRALEARAAFRWSFGAGAAVALLAGICLVALVWQSERLAHQRSQFAAAAAHELRTPLAGLRMYGEMLAEGLGDPARTSEYAQRVADEAERLGRVVANVLNFSRLERGALAVRPEPGDLAAAARDCIARQSPALEAAGVRVELKVKEDLPPVRFDRDALAQILQNLLDNAEKYTRGCPDRLLRVELSGAPGGVALTAADRGAGIPPGLRSRLFQPFQRGAGPDAPAGLGLGLALARVLARAQGGELTGANAPEGGAVFTLTLPHSPALGGPGASPQS